jgi:hypothetical protein
MSDPHESDLAELDRLRAALVFLRKEVEKAHASLGQAVSLVPTFPPDPWSGRRIALRKALLDMIAEQEKLREESESNIWFARHAHGIVVLRGVLEWLDAQEKA